MNDFERDVTELADNMLELLNDAYEPIRIENERVTEHFSYAQIQTLEKLKKFGWSWSKYDYDTGVITCNNAKCKSLATVDPEGNFKR